MRNLANRFTCHQYTESYIDRKSGDSLELQCGCSAVNLIASVSQARILFDAVVSYPTTSIMAAFSLFEISEVEPPLQELVDTTHHKKQEYWLLLLLSRQ